MRLTKHGKERIKKRLGTPKRSLEKIANDALTHGITHKEAKGRLSKYMDKLFLQHGNANNMRIYHEKIFVFKNDILITVLPLPHNLCDLANKIIKERKWGDNFETVM